jgi:DNA-binding transcriptional LysR family regulator
MQRLRFDLDDLQALVAVVDQGGFRAAALALNLSQPALSRRIAKLEAALNVRLLERSTRRVSLTLVGREFHQRAVAILKGIDASLAGIGELALSEHGEVTVACVPSVAHNLLPPIMRRFQAQFPRIVLRLFDEGAHEVLGNVARGDSDLGINFLGADTAGIDFEPIVHERFVLACRADHALARRRAIDWEDLAGQSYMTVAKSSGNRMMLDRARAPDGKRLQPMIEVRHVSTLLEMVKAGLGVAVVPQLAMPADADSVLRAVPMADAGITRTLGVIRRSGHTLSPAAQHFYDMLKDALPR